MRRFHKRRLRCARIVYACLVDAWVALRSLGGSVRDAARCMTEAALVPLDLEDGIVGYDAVLAEIK